MAGALSLPTPPLTAVAVIFVVAAARPVFARRAVPALAIGADQPAVHVGDAADAAVDIAQRRAVPPAVHAAAIGDHPVAENMHIAAALQVRSARHALRM